MIKVLKYHKKSFSWGTLKDLDMRSSTVWVDCLNPSKADLENLSKQTCVNLEDIKECLDPDERPRVTEFDDYTVIAFKSPYNHGREVITITIGIILLKYGIVTLRMHNIKAISKLQDMPDSQKRQAFEKGPSYVLYRLIDFIIDDYFQVMEDIEEKMDRVENKVFRNVQDHVMNQIFKLKKTLIYFHKALTANREVIALMEKDTVKELKQAHVRRFRIIYNDINELIDIESTYKDILTTQIEIYLSQVSNNLNIVMKKMAALGSFVLIPTLISGIYGMNFRFMPELQQPWGYPAVIGLMMLSVLGLYIYFKKNDWL